MINEQKQKIYESQNPTTTPTGRPTVNLPETAGAKQITEGTGTTAITQVDTPLSAFRMQAMNKK